MIQLVVAVAFALALAVAIVPPLMVRLFAVEECPFPFTRGVPSMSDLLYRQGDVLLTRIDSVPEDTKEVKPNARGQLVLANGEATGHLHAVLARRGVKLRSKGDRLYLTARSGVDVTHDEHDAINLPAGTYEVRRQREYSPEAIRQVAD